MLPQRSATDSNISRWNILPDLIKLWGFNIQTQAEAKKHRPIDREMTTPLFMLRYVQLGIAIWDLDLLSIGMVNDMFVEQGNDEYQYAIKGTQEDMDRFWRSPINKYSYQKLYGLSIQEIIVFILLTIFECVDFLYSDYVNGDCYNYNMGIIRDLTTDLIVGSAIESASYVGGKIHEKFGKNF